MHLASAGQGVHSWGAPSLGWGEDAEMRAAGLGWGGAEGAELAAGRASWDGI